ncbi:DUF542 domain-containing protein [Terrisporobacter sp.]
MKNINRNLSLGECVVIYPPIVEKFNEIQLDYCCGGDRSLEVALEEKGVDIDKFIEDINAALEKFKFDNTVYVDWSEKSSGELINHIVNTHHAKTFELLKEIDPLMVKVFKVHYNHAPQTLTLVHKLFGQLKSELEEHLIKEEVVLFPKMIEFNDSLVEDEDELFKMGKADNEEGKEKLIKELRNDLEQNHGIKDKIKDVKKEHEIREEIRSFEEEHDAAGDIIKELAEVTDDFTAPEWACASFKLLYLKMHELEKDIFVHIHKENNILFKRY